MILGGIIAAAATGQIDLVAKSIVSGGEQAITLCLALVAVLSFWMGIARVAEKAGLLRVLARLLVPFLRPFFPSLRDDDEALKHIVLNFSANLLGLGNAATPFGLKAMRAMQDKNSDPDTATDAMCTLLVLNTAGMTFIPSSVIALRAASGSQDPTATVAITLLAGVVATSTGLVADYLFRRLRHRVAKRGKHKWH
ncbi:MAG TPA: spore maturation protein [Firmicutes bacterium]|jgi:spore maturation protein A|nr:spore maturation protein [Bacillota bacterium]